MRSLEPTVRARTLDGFVPLVRELGGDAAQILTRVGIAPDATARPLEWISFPAVLRAYGVAASETRCQTFGLRLGTVRPLGFLVFFQLILSSPRYTLFPYTTGVPSGGGHGGRAGGSA